MRRPLAWLSLAVAAPLVGWGFAALGVPSPWLLGALLLGLVVALVLPSRLAIPGPLFVAAQAVTGVMLGSYLESSSLSALAHDWLPVSLVSAGTLGVSLCGGLGLSRITSLDAPTAALGMIAGGASGIVPIARELNADDRLVAFMQYMRILVVVVLTPILIGLAFPGAQNAGGAGGAAAGGTPLLATPLDWLLTVTIAGAAPVAIRARIPGGALLGPMIVAGVVKLSGLDVSLVTPPLVREAAFAVIGLQVGLGFTVQTIRQVGRLLVPVLLCMAFLLAACFGLAAALAATSSVTLLDAYLATTPGGIYAVLAIALGAGANTTFIVAVQGLRLLVMVLIAPIAVRLLFRRPVAVTG